MGIALSFASANTKPDLLGGILLLPCVSWVKYVSPAGKFTNVLQMCLFK